MSRILLAQLRRTRYNLHIEMDSLSVWLLIVSVFQWLLGKLATCRSTRGVSVASAQFLSEVAGLSLLYLLLCCCCCSCRCHRSRALCSSVGNLIRQLDKKEPRYESIQIKNWVFFFTQVIVMMGIELILQSSLCLLWLAWLYQLQRKRETSPFWQSLPSPSSSSSLSFFQWLEQSTFSRTGSEIFQKCSPRTNGSWPGQNQNFCFLCQAMTMKSPGTRNCAASQKWMWKLWSQTQEKKSNFFELWSIILRLLLLLLLFFFFTLPNDEGTEAFLWIFKAPKVQAEKLLAQLQIH